MARYIDADKLIAGGWRLERQASSGKILSVMSIADVPTADVVEVCRCKDCGYSEQMNSLYCNYFNKNVDEDDFCSQGG